MSMLSDTTRQLCPAFTQQHGSCTREVGHSGKHSWQMPVEQPPELLPKYREMAHYTQGSVECLDAIASALTSEEFRGYCKGQVIRYVWREGAKGGDSDLQKALDYLKWALSEAPNESS